MEGYICIKACAFGGIAYSIGDTIPSDAVLRSRVKTLVSQGIIAPAKTITDAKTLQKENRRLVVRVKELEEAAAESPKLPAEDESAQKGIVIPIKAKDGILELIMAPEDIISAVTTMQLNAEEAAKAVGEIKKEETLILIDALDTRKTVKTAIVARVKDLEGGDKEDEGQGDA